MSQRVVAVLGRGVVPAQTPILRADDLGVLRGDGIFETMHVRDGRAWLIEDHLDRMSRSASLVEITLPPREALLDLVGQALAEWPDGVEGALRLVCTRGGEDGEPVTAFATLAPVGARQIQGRQEGIAIATASLGVAADARPAAPWLLGGAKTLSYAVNMATQRWAGGQGVDDVLWVSSDGYALEAPTSTLVWLAGDTLWTVPAASTGILPGITARCLLDHAGDLGYAAGERMIRPVDLTEVDGAWFASSVRGLAEIRSLDGKPLNRAGDTARMLSLLGF
ncbi:aminotransferase class IV [Rugosimonospora africana]|nr:aminotransferase class IV [Rugosimonospora africana]